MTDFVTWWADHWPLIAAILLYPIYHTVVSGWWFAFTEWLATRKREPLDVSAYVDTTDTGNSTFGLGLQFDERRRGP